MNGTAPIAWLCLRCRRPPFFGVNIDYFSKYLRKFFQKIGPAGGWGRGRPVHPRPTQAGPAPTPPRALLFKKICVNIQKIININAKTLATYYELSSQFYPNV